MFRFSYMLVMVVAATLLATPPAWGRTIRFADWLGMNTPFLMFDHDMRDRQMAALNALGLKWVRVPLHWYHLEPQEGVYELAALDDTATQLAAHGLEALFCLVGSSRFATTAPVGTTDYIDVWPPRDNAEFADRLVRLAARYPMVKYWQIWNEPNSPGFWQPQEDAAAYAHLFTTAATALKTALPDRKAVMAGMMYFSVMPTSGKLMLQVLGESGDVSRADVVAYHPYTDQPEGEPGTVLLETGNWLNAGLRRFGAHEIWATEFGWSTYPGPVVMQSLISEDEQADYLLRRLSLMMTMDYDRVFWFALSDLDERAPPRDRFYGLLRRDGTPKPAYHALAYYLRVLGPEVTLLETPPAPTEVHLQGWRTADGRRVYLVWGPAGTSATLPRFKQAQQHDPLQQKHQTLPADTPITLTGSLLMVEVTE